MGDERPRGLPAWILGAGAALAASVATTPPGLALLLAEFDRPAPDLLAILPELLVAALMATFGAISLRAETTRRGRWIGPVIAVLNVGAIVAMGLAYDVGLTAGSTDTGPALVIGVFVVAAVAVGNAVVALVAWLLLSALAKALVKDLAQPDGEVVARTRAGRWVVIVATAHVVIKGVTGGPVLFGVVAASVAITLLLPVRRAHPSPFLPIAIVAVALGLGSCGALRFRSAQRADAAKLALCSHADTTRENDALARAVRQVPGVADALSDVKGFSANRFEVTVFVLPEGGGPLTPPLGEAVQRAVRSVKCTESKDGARPTIEVKQATYVPLVIAARVVVQPGSAEARVRERVEAAVRGAFEVRKGHEVIRGHERPNMDLPTSVREGETPLTLDLRVGADSLQLRTAMLEPGSVVIVERVDVEVVPPPTPPP